MKKLILTSIFLVLLSTKSFSVALNDSCQGATLLIPAQSGSDPQRLHENLGNSSSVLTTACATSVYLDLWYYFVANNDSQALYLESFTSGLIPQIELYSGTCGALTSVNCPSAGNEVKLYNLTAGQTYYIRAYDFITPIEYEISLFNIASNDSCITAYTLPISRNDQPFVGAKSFWSTGSHPGANPCAFNDYDIWFNFTALDTAQLLYLDGIASYFEYELLSGSCGSLVSQQCGNFSNSDHAIFHNLTSGQQYYFRLLTYQNSSAPLFKISLMDILPNDYCAGAVTIPMSTSFEDNIKVQGDLWFSSSVAGSCNSENDLWYKFTPSASEVFIKAENYNTMSFSTYSGNCGSLTNLQCSIPVNSKITGLTAGNTYYLQLHSATIGQQFFSISVTPALNNDDCNGAITLTPSDKLFGEFSVEATTFSSTQSLPGCTGNADDDVWFTFTATRNNHVLDVAIESAAISGSGFIYELYSGSCASLTSIKCDTVQADLLEQLKNLTVGQQYYLRLYSRAAGTYSHFKIAIFRSMDECEDAVPINITNQYNYYNDPIFNTRTATASPVPVCIGNPNRDVWVSFIATQTQHSYKMRDYLPDNFSPYVEIFSGNCASLVSMKCKFGAGGYVSNLTPGQQYYARIYSATGPYYRFHFNVFSAPYNDDITNAREIPVTNSNVRGISKQLVAGATQNFGGFCTGFNVNAFEDVWYYFVAPQTAQYVTNTTSVFANAFTLEAFTQYNTTSAIQSSKIGCGYLTTTIPTNGTVNAGDTVWVRIYSDTSSTQYTGEFDLSISINNSTANNDEPADALPLSLTNDYYYSYDANIFTLSSISSGCQTTTASYNDDWYKFDAPSVAASIVLDENENQESWLELFSGSPGSLTLVECSDNILNLPLTLTPGQQYFVRALHKSGGNNFRIGIFYNDTLEKNSSIAVDCMGPNLVPNPSMECTTCNTDCKASLLPTGTDLAGYYSTDDWFLATDGSADYMNSCDDAYYGQANTPTSHIHFSTSSYVWSDIVPRNGKGYLGVFIYSLSNYREYVETELTQELIPGHSYLVSFYVNKNFNTSLQCNKVGALLTTDKVLVTNNNSSNLLYTNLPFEPQVSWNDSFYVGGDRWYNVSGIIVADKPYKYLTIGNFENNSGTSTLNNGSLLPGQFSPQGASYINIDDVTVAEVPATIDDSCKASFVSVPDVKPRDKTTLLIYPNPAQNSINWNLNQVNGKEFTVEVFTITGQVIYRAKTQKNSMSIEKFKSGIYFIRINDSENNYTARFIKE